MVGYARVQMLSAGEGISLRRCYWHYACLASYRGHYQQVFHCIVLVDRHGDRSWKRQRPFKDKLHDDDDDDKGKGNISV